MIRFIFYMFELFLFFLPILHPNFFVRLFLIFIYFVGHQFKVQHSYIVLKKSCIENYLDSKKKDRINIQPRPIDFVHLFLKNVQAK